MYLSSSKDETEPVLNEEGEEHPVFAVEHERVTYLEAATRPL